MNDVAYQTIRFNSITNSFSRTYLGQYTFCHVEQAVRRFRPTLDEDLDRDLDVASVAADETNHPSNIAKRDCRSRGTVPLRPFARERLPDGPRCLILQLEGRHVAFEIVLNEERVALAESAGKRLAGYESTAMVQRARIDTDAETYAQASVCAKR